jgi:hypothetical protein
MTLSTLFEVWDTGCRSSRSYHCPLLPKIADPGRSRRELTQTFRIFLEATGPLGLQASFFADTFFELIVCEGERAAAGVVNQHYLFGAK